MGKRKIFLVDDHDIARQGLRRLIESEGDLTVCGEAGDGVDALNAIAKAAPDALVADLSMPNMAGLDLIKAVKKKFPKLPVLVISMHEESLYGERALVAGARGYLMKKESAAKVAPALREVLAGRRYMSEVLKEKLLDTLAGGAAPGERSPVDTLSDRELQVFTRIGRGLKTGEIAEALHLSVKTVESYREQIKSKLRVDTASALTQYAVQWAREINEN
jgi:DNA-binding NarL/FixJ family response regulator